VPPLDVLGTTPVLLLGDGQKVEGEVWFENSSANDVKIDHAVLSVTFSTGLVSAAIGIPPDAAIAAGATRRLLVSVGVPPFTPPASYPASIDLTTSVGGQTIPATFVVPTLLRVAVVADQQVFTGVQSTDVVSGSVVVRNIGNVPVDVGKIPDEQLLEVKATERVLAVNGSGTLIAEPAVGLLAVAGSATFVNPTPTIPVGSWTDLTYQMTVPAGLPTNAHLRVLPRILTERFPIDVLTK
jgi:hypothetical protein